MKLYETYQEIDQLLQDLVDTETPGDALDRILNRLKDVKGEANAKAANIGKMILGAEAESEAIGAAISRLKARKDRQDKLAERLREYLASFLHHDTKIRTSEIVISFRRSQRVELYLEPHLLPPAYQRVKVEPDKVQLKLDLLAGEEIKGAELVEYHHLTIK